MSDYPFSYPFAPMQAMHQYAENLFGPLLPEMVLAGGILAIILLMATDFDRYGSR